MKRPAYRSSLVYLLVLIVAAAAGIMAYGEFHQPARPLSERAATVATSKSTDKQPSPRPTQELVPHTDAGLQQILEEWAARQPFRVAIAVQELDGKLRTAQSNQNTQMVTASTYKLYVAYAVLHEIEQGSYGLQTVTRNGQTVEAALQGMILDSSNTAAEALGFLVGWDGINKLAAAIGAMHTDINNYNLAGLPENGSKLTTAADLNLLLTKLQQNELLDTSHTRLLLELMRNQHWRERIPSGVPANVAVADKPGWLSNVQNDAAIVYGPTSTYTLVIMTDGTTTRPLAELSKLVYEYLET